jgi:hypothetical protein
MNNRRNKVIKKEKDNTLFNIKNIKKHYKIQKSH